MATYDFSKYSLYRWRYVIGYAAVGLLLAGVLLFAGLFLPGGLSASEMDAVVRSHSLTTHLPVSLAVPNLPYHALQAFLLQVFGASIITIKLPSLILALFSAIGLILLLRRWFKPGIAILASLIAISNSQFLFIAQSGTPDIMWIFWPIMLLLLGTQVTRSAHSKRRFIWKLLFAITAALSLYTPLMVYPLLAVSLTVLLHPHLRSIVRRLSKLRLGFVLLAFGLLSVPLVYLMLLAPGLGPELLGLPASWPIDLPANLLNLGRQYFLFWKPSSGVMMTPVFGLGSAILICLGFVHIVRSRNTTQSYLIILWIVCLLPSLILNPLYTTATFVPAVLLLAAGVQALVSYWYRLFPLNPYARIAGFIPIALLVIAAIVLGLSRYTYGYHYNPATVEQFSKDLSLLPKGDVKLLVGEDERAFWEAIASYRHSLTIISSPGGDTFTATHQAEAQTQTYSARLPGYTIYRIITSPLSHDADRFYIYQKTAE